MKRLISILLILTIAINYAVIVQADENTISASLLHTASYWGGKASPTDEDKSVALDGIKQIFNREGTSQQWRATAYAEFDFEDRVENITSDMVKSATLSFYANVPSNRTFKIKTVKDVSVVDFTSVIDVLPMTEEATVQGLGSSDAQYSVDVTNGVKTMLADTQTKIIFGFDSCSSTVYMYGMGAETSMRPVLNIELKPLDGKTITINYATGDGEIIKTEYDIESPGNRYSVSEDKFSEFYCDVLGKRYKYEFDASLSKTYIESVSAEDNDVNTITLVFNRSEMPSYYEYNPSSRTYCWDFKAWDAQATGGSGLEVSGAKLGGSGVYWGTFNIVSTEDNNNSLSYTPEYDGTLMFTLGYSNAGMHVLPNSCNNQDEEMVASEDIAVQDAENELVYTAKLKAGTTYYVVGDKVNPETWICIENVSYTIAENVVRDEISIQSVKYKDGMLYNEIEITEGVTGKLICGVYDKEGVLLSVAGKKCENNQTVVCGVDEAQEGKVKVFLWDSLNTAKPLSLVAEKNWNTIADKSYLSYVMELYGNINMNEYQKESADAFNEVLLQAQAVLEDEETDQFEVDEVAAELIKAYEGLRMKEDIEGKRTIINENSGWLFIKEKNATSMPEEIVLKETEKLTLYEWEKVDLPHTWNAQDGSDGGSDYDRTKGWYRKSMYIDETYRNKKLYLEFGAAGTQAELYVNGVHVPYANYDIYGEGNAPEYAHKGGFSKFRFDVTDYVKYGESNLVAVLVDNTRTTDIAPLEGDFNMQGGLYRGASLVITDNVHVDMLDSGSDGVYLTTQKVTELTDTQNTDFNLTVASKIVNDSDSEQTITITGELREPAEYEIPENEYIKEHLRFNPEDMYTPGGKTITEIPSETVTLKAGESYDFNKTVLVESPKLWDGLDFPYRYEVILKISSNDMVTEEISEYVGFKYCYMPTLEKDGGEVVGGKFYLNGREYVLRGANKHQDWGRGEDALGYAIREENMLSDAGIIYELGMNSVRLAHYQHSNEEIELYDKLGVLVWSELGLVDNIISGGSGAYKSFLNVTKAQLAELIKQQYNHPSIYIWSLSNELRRELNRNLGNASNDREVPTCAELFTELNNLAKLIDPVRPTTYSAFHLFGRQNDWDSDSVAMNLYPYWYTFLASSHGGNESMTGQVLYHFNKLETLKPIGVSEYGGSAVIGYTSPYESDGTVKDFGDETANQYSTTYQTYIHEKVYNEIVNELPWLWCSYVWQLFDSASDKKGSLLAGTNDKGLVSYDHVMKKDSYYFYKANWNDFDFFTYIVNEDNLKVTTGNTIIRVYSNYDKVQLYLNGESYGEAITDINSNDGVVDGLGVFMWYDIPVQDGVEISVEGIND